MQTYTDHVTSETLLGFGSLVTYTGPKFSPISQDGVDFSGNLNIKKNEKNEFKTGDYSSFKISKIYFLEKKSLCYFFG